MSSSVVVKSQAIYPLRKDPRLAGILSAIFPGSGQIYNGQWWKAPLIWSTLGTSLYLTIWSWQQYQFFLQEYRNALEGRNNQTGLPPAILESYVLYWRTILEWSIAGCVALYTIQVVDAVIYAYLRGGPGTFQAVSVVTPVDWNGRKRVRYARVAELADAAS